MSDKKESDPDRSTCVEYEEGDRNDLLDMSSMSSVETTEGAGWFVGDSRGSVSSGTELDCNCVHVSGRR